MTRRILVCAAFATWCFLDTWVEYAEGGVAHFARQDPVRAVVVPVVCLTVSLALMLFGAWAFCRRRQVCDRIQIHLLFLALCLPPLGAVSVAAVRAMPAAATAAVGHPWFWPAALLIAFVPLTFAILRPRRASQAARSILLNSWLLLLLVFGRAYYLSLRYPHATYADGALAEPLGPPPSHVRVVWIIFDELSQTIAFGNRPANLALPNLDRLREGAFYASSAESPANLTEVAIPSLILGEQVTSVSHRGPDNLQLTTTQHSNPTAFRAIANVFDAARLGGYNTALVGWYHPYGRLISHSLTKCYWTAAWLPVGVEERTQPQPLAAAMLDRAHLQLMALPAIGHLPGVFPGADQRHDKIERFSWLLERAREIVADRSIGLSLIHLPIPHPVGIYSRSRGSLTAESHTGYLDNVALADRTFGELRQALERAGLWDGAAVLVSADHGWRPNIWRNQQGWTPEEEAVSHQDTLGVPFLLKLPGQTSGVVYNRKFNTLVTRRLIARILDGRLTDAKTIAGLIEQP